MYTHIYIHIYIYIYLHIDIIYIYIYYIHIVHAFGVRKEGPSWFPLFEDYKLQPWLPDLIEDWLEHNQHRWYGLGCKGSKAHVEWQDRAISNIWCYILQALQNQIWLRDPGSNCRGAPVQPFYSYDSWCAHLWTTKPCSQPKNGLYKMQWLRLASCNK